MAKLKRPHDPVQQEYVERELQKLMQEQEMLRQAKGLGGPTDKMPNTGGSGQFGSAEFKFGGKKFKHSGNNETSYMVGKYSTPEDKPAFWDLRFTAPELTLEDQLREEQNLNSPVIPKTSAQNAKIIPGDYNSVALQEPTIPTKSKFNWSEAGVLGAQLAGDIVGLGYSLKKPNYAKYQRINPNLVNYNQAATDVTNQSGLMEQSAAQALRNQGQSSGAYLNNRINLATKLGQQTNAQLAELRMNEANTNAGIKNEALTRNAEIQRAEVETNAKEKDARMQALVGHLGGIGSKVAGYSKDKKQVNFDKLSFKDVMELYPYLFRDKEAYEAMKKKYNSDNKA